jgi:hypothetical protein
MNLFDIDLIKCIGTSYAEHRYGNKAVKKSHNFRKEKFRVSKIEHDLLQTTSLKARKCHYAGSKMDERYL